MKPIGMSTLLFRRVSVKIGTNDLLLRTHIKSCASENDFLETRCLIIVYLESQEA